MSELPDWIYEGAEVWVLKTGGWRATPQPRPAEVVRFTAQRIVVHEKVLGEVMFTKDRLAGIGGASDYMLISPNDQHVVMSLRLAAVAEAMWPLREVFREMQLGARIGWNELPNAREAAEALHEASLTALQGIERAAERYGDGEWRRA